MVGTAPGSLVSVFEPTNTDSFPQVTIGFPGQFQLVGTGFSVIDSSKMVISISLGSF